MPPSRCLDSEPGVWRWMSRAAGRWRCSQGRFHLTAATCNAVPSPKKKFTGNNNLSSPGIDGIVNKEPDQLLSWDVDSKAHIEQLLRHQVPQDQGIGFSIPIPRVTVTWSQTSSWPLARFMTEDKPISGSLNQDTNANYLLQVFHKHGILGCRCTCQRFSHQPDHSKSWTSVFSHNMPLCGVTLSFFSPCRLPYCQILYLIFPLPTAKISFSPSVRGCQTGNSQINQFCIYLRRAGQHVCSRAREHLKFKWT